MATNNCTNGPYPLSATQGGLGVASPTAHGVLVAEGASAATPIVLGAGQILIGTTASDPSAASLTPGTGIAITSVTGSITIASTGVGSVVWNDVSGTTQAAAINSGYIISNAGQTTVTLPATAAEGSVFGVAGKGAAGWILQANTGQTIHFGNASTSSGGSLTSTNLYDSVQIVCVTANTTFTVLCAVGNLTVA